VLMSGVWIGCLQWAWLLLLLLLPLLEVLPER